MKYVIQDNYKMVLDGSGGGGVCEKVQFIMRNINYILYVILFAFFIVSHFKMINYLFLERGPHGLDIRKEKGDYRIVIAIKAKTPFKVLFSFGQYVQRCCYKTVDSATAASRNSACSQQCIIQQMSSKSITDRR